MLKTQYMYQNKYTEEFIEFASKSYERNTPLQIKCVKNGLVLPLKVSDTGIPLLGIGGVLEENGDYVIESAQIGKGDTADRFIGKYEYNQEDVEYSGERVIYIGAFPVHWGHYLVDMTYRFWIFNQSGFENYKIVYCANNAYIQGGHLDFLKMLGVDEKRLLRIDKPTCFSQIYIPEPGYMACDYYTSEYRDVFTKLKNNLSVNNLKPYDKIYMSRRHLKKARQSEFGEKAIEENFAQNGFQILYMEELSFVEQVFYISNCKVMAALSGTLCHNVLFAKEGTTLIILNKTHLLNTHQVLINQMMRCRAIYVDVYVEPLKNFPTSYGAGPFLMDARKLQGLFEEYEMQLIPDETVKRWHNLFLYLLKCATSWCNENAQRLYTNIYRAISRHEWLIRPFRIAKQMVRK